MMSRSRMSRTQQSTELIGRFIKLTTALATGRTEYSMRPILNYANDSTDTERILVVSILDKSRTKQRTYGRNGGSEHSVWRKSFISTYVSIQQRILLSTGNNAEIRLLLASRTM